MAIGYDACATGSTGLATTLTVAHTCAIDPNRYLLVGIKGATDPNISVAYAGAPMTQLMAGLLETNYGVWGLVNPASGLNNIVVTHLTGSARMTLNSISFYGVDQVFPVRENVRSNNGILTVFTATFTANFIGDMMVLGCSRTQGSANWTAVADQTEVCEIAVGYSTDAGSHDITWYYAVADAAPDSMQAEASVARQGECIATALRPYVPAMGRAVRYYFNIWDPRAAVRDRNDRIVPPSELEPDSWVEVQGHVLPDPAAYETFIVDPTKARVVEVNATENGATMRANRSQFADVLISRASAGRS